MHYHSTHLYTENSLTDGFIMHKEMWCWLAGYGGFVHIGTVIHYIFIYKKKADFPKMV